MTAYLQPGDRITLAVPDFSPRRDIASDHAYWQSVYTPFGVEVVHISVHPELSHPVVVAVLRWDANPAEGDPA